METKTKEIIQKCLDKLVGQKMMRGYRWQFMPCFVFANTDGQKTEIHAYSRCMICQDNKEILDSNNIVVPAEGVEPREDNDYGWGDCVFDEQFRNIWHIFPLTVISAEIKDNGTIRMRLSDGCIFTVVPWQNNPYEAWRILNPDKDGSHLVYLGTGTIEE